MVPATFTEVTIPPHNRTSLCSFCATEWKTRDLQLTCCCLVLLPHIWKSSLPSSTLSVCPENGNQKLFHRYNSYMQGEQSCCYYFSASLVKDVCLAVPFWNMNSSTSRWHSTHPENIWWRNRGSFETYVFSHFKSRWSSTSCREERWTHHYSCFP